MKATRQDWQDANTYSRLIGIDRAGLMWEWLRRDAGYVAWFQRAGSFAQHVEPRFRDPAIWGLHFR
ncbi:transcriptional regulator domain-containing protein [Sphingomonas sp.]|uniref:transcriptional regulator domain-containing protein n=1 Tax=Sphingomonas sp. TaxID=28214 RepID=UPI003AFFC555